jgi:hypothetical protein
MQKRRMGSVAAVGEERRVKKRRRLMRGAVAGFVEERRPFRVALIRELMAKYKVTHRMVVRCVAEFLPDIRWNVKMYRYALEEAVIRPLPSRTRNINKLRPGLYVEKELGLNVDSTGQRKWIFQYRLGPTIHNMVLGGPEISLTKARQLATKVRRKLAAGENPADGSS